MPKKYRDKAKHVIEKLNLQKRLQMMVSAAAANNANNNDYTGNNKDATPKKSRPPSQQPQRQSNGAGAGGADNISNYSGGPTRRNKITQESSSPRNGYRNNNPNTEAVNLANANAKQNPRVGSASGTSRKSNVRAVPHPPVVLPSHSSQSSSHYSGFDHMNNFDKNNNQISIQQQNGNNGEHVIPRPRKKSIRSPSTQLQAALAAAVGGAGSNYSHNDNFEDNQQYNQYSISQQQQQQQQQ